MILLQPTLTLILYIDRTIVILKALLSHCSVWLRVVDKKKGSATTVDYGYVRQKKKEIITGERLGK